MKKIYHDKIKMRPKAYFVIGSFLTFVGLVTSVVVSVFFVGLMRFFLRTHGPMGKYRLEQMISSFPWWMAIVAILGTVIGIWLLCRYDFSYKINFKIIVLVFVMTIVVAGWIIDMIRLNDILFRQGPGQGVMRKFFQENNMHPEQQGRGWWKNNFKHK